MDSRTQERVEQWDSRPFRGGYDELETLSGNGFSGAVTAAGTWLFMLNGRVVGVVDGEIEDFEHASGTVHAAPDPALPLLCSMQERGGDRRGRYYTNETPLSEVDDTLQSGSFTGFVELSEQVLSGDYYLVYYGGRRMAIAFIGNAERLLTGDEAFERAADEVGIYEVFDVDVEVTDVPTPADDLEPSSEPTGVDPETTGAEPDTTATDPETAPDASTESNAADSTTTESGVESIADDGEPSSPDESESAPSAGDATRPASAADLRETDDLIDVPESTTDEPSSSDEGVEGVDHDQESEPASAVESHEADPGVGSDAAVDEANGTDSTAASGSDPERSETAGDREATTTDASEPTTDTSETATSEPTADTTEPTTDTAEPTANAPGATDAASDSTEAASASGASSVEGDADDRRTDDSNPDLERIEEAAAKLDERGIDWSGAEADDEAGPPSGSDDATPERDAVTAATGGESPASADEAADGDDEQVDERLKREERWRETRSIPSIDPAKTSDGVGRRREGPRTRSRGSSTDESSAATDESSATTGASASATGSTAGVEATGSGGGRSGTVSDDATASAREDGVRELRERLEAATEARDRLQEKTEALEAERDELQAENEELSNRLEQLRAKVQRLETALERERARSLEVGSAEEDDGGHVPPDRALSGTNLFVRYDTKSDATLEMAHDGDSEREAVASNLRLEHHTDFEAGEATVTGQPFEEFLASRMEYQFVDWLTGTLLFEIRDTGHGDDMVDLYDAIPRIDRVELQATVSLEDDDDGRAEVSFDVVAFDKMGSPLVVANFNDSREPADEEMLADMEEAASAVKASHPDFGAAMVVTSSYFAPGALEVAEEATSGGFFSRGSKQSYVTISRKHGYHLCLAESRSGGFHMTVPEL